MLSLEIVQNVSQMASLHKNKIMGSHISKLCQEATLPRLRGRVFCVVRSRVNRLPAYCARFMLHRTWPADTVAAPLVSFRQLQVSHGPVQSHIRIKACTRKHPALHFRGHVSAIGILTRSNPIRRVPASNRNLQHTQSEGIFKSSLAHSHAEDIILAQNHVFLGNQTVKNRLN